MEMHSIGSGDGGSDGAGRGRRQRIEQDSAEGIPLQLAPIEGWHIEEGHSEVVMQDGDGDRIDNPTPRATVVQVDNDDDNEDHAQYPTFPPRLHLRGHSKNSNNNNGSILNNLGGGASASGGENRTLAARVPATKFAPLPDSSRRQFARDSANSIHRDDGGGGGGGDISGHSLLKQKNRNANSVNEHGRPSSTDSLPLQRVTTHGRDSIMEMDLADAAMEPMSAHEMAAPSMHEQAKRRHHRRNRRRTPSIASKQTKRTVRSRAGKAMERLRRRRNSSSSSSSSSSSGSSSSSSSSGIDWRFWRSSTASSATDDSYIPPEPTFTLYTPRLKGNVESKLPSQKDLVYMAQHPNAVPRPYTSKSSEQRDKTPGIEEQPVPDAAQVFDVLHSRTLNPCLDRLKEFWLERDQQEGLGGDLGAASSSSAAAAAGYPYLTTRKAMPTSGSRSRRNSPSRSRPGSRVHSRSHSPDPSHPATSRKTGGVGAAWWLDVQCASTADMRQLRRLIPMHPLTIEDILSQETREKIETYEQLGYYFVAFRALDETYFRYSEETSSASSSSSTSSASKTSSREQPQQQQQQPAGDADSDQTKTDKCSDNDDAGKGEGNLSPEIEEKSMKLVDAPTHPVKDTKRKRGIVEIVEGHKEGVEGAGVGAVNMYLVVFGDGIISDISKHSNRVKERIDHFGVAQNISSHWIAYGLMDSIVDTFFPLIDFIEAEADDIDEFLANPLQVDESATPVSSANTQGGRSFRNVIRQQWRRFRPAWLQVRTPQVTQFFGLIKTTAIITQREANFSRMGEKKHRPHHSNAGPKTLSHKALLGVNSDLYDRGKMLTRIAVARKLVMGLSRLLVPKNDVVRGLRKRLRDETSHLIATEPGQRHDIGIYLGDLQDHIITMQQTLHFFDTMLSHDHPAYLGVLRLAYEAAKIGNDKAIVRLNIILVMFLPINIYCGLFGTNVKVPRNARDENNKPLAVWGFGIIIVGLLFVVSSVIGYAYWAIRGTRKKYERKGVQRRL